MSGFGKILAVDDDPRNIDILKHLLKDMCELSSASNGDEALQKVNEFMPDIVLLDIMMSGMNGYDICRKIKESNNIHTKVILVSAKAMLDERLMGYEAGADDYIVKPFDHEEFLAKIRIFLKLKAVEDEFRSLNSTLESAVLERTKQLVEAEKVASSAKAYVENIIKSMVDPLIVFSLVGKVQKVNHAAERVLSYTADEFMSLGIEDLILEQDILSDLNLVSTLKEGVIRNRSLTFISKDQRNIPVIFSSSVICDDQGVISGIVCVAKDMTEQKKVELENETMQQQIIQASKLASIGEMAAGIAHEINNPLTIIQGNLEIIGEYFEEKKNTEFLKVIKKQQNSVDRITNIIRGLKNYSRVDSSVQAVINLHDVLDQSISILEYIYKNDNIKIVKNYQSLKPLSRGNVGKFQQVAINFITNARDALEAKSGGVVEVRTKDQGNELIVQFIDNGSGIEKNIMKKIFEPFFTSKPVGKGTGLGLSIALSIINEMNGKIAVESEVNQGTVFTLTFAKAEEPEKVELVSSKEIDKDKEEVFQKFSGKVLIVEDEKEIAEFLGHFLSELGFEVDQVANGKQAIENLAASQYKILITNLKMPVMDGYKLIALLKKLNLKNLKIIMLSGSLDLGRVDDDSDEFKKIREIKNSVNAMIKKPFLKKDIYKVVKEMM